MKVYSRILPAALLAAVAVLLVGREAPCSEMIGPVIATFPNDLVLPVASPTQPYVYGVTDPLGKTVEAINTSTLTVTGTVNLPGIPGDLVLSPDGTTMYVVDGANSSINVVNTSTMTLTKSIPLPSQPVDVAVGLNNQLLVEDVANPSDTTFVRIQSVDPATGAVTSLPGLGPTSLFAGLLRISPDRKTLYLFSGSVSPPPLEAIDVSTGTLLGLQRNTSLLGTPGENLALSPDGTTIIPVSNTGSLIPVLRTSDFSSLGELTVGQKPYDATFSPDGRYIFVDQNVGPAQNHTSSVDIFDASTFNLLSSVQINAGPDALVVDGSGKELFVSYVADPYGTGGLQTDVYSLVPEPSAWALLATGGLALSGLAISKRRARRVMRAVARQ